MHPGVDLRPMPVLLNVQGRSRVEAFQVADAADPFDFSLDAVHCREEEDGKNAEDDNGHHQLQQGEGEAALGGMHLF